VDPAITVRFASVIPYGRGEFSVVYRVEKPLVDKENIEKMPPFSSFDSTNRVWVVKKTKKPYIGMRDRARKIREAVMLDKLRGCDHIVQFVCSWECEKHLYMQTEFCEAGSLDRYLDEVGRAVRLDDFRIWKILFELCLVGFHLALT
jgi:mitosis inhibitor protein kinase SWE1